MTLRAGNVTMAGATLLISSKNYSSWSLRGFLLARMARLTFQEKTVDPADPATRAELLLQSSSIRVPALEHDGVLMWDVLAIAEYLNEVSPRAGMLPADRAARARCRSVSGEMHSGFSALRSSLPMNLRLHRPGYRVWSAARADIERVLEIWRECLDTWRGPWLFGRHPTIADAMYAPVVTRLRTYDVALDGVCERYAAHIMEWQDLKEWIAGAADEPEQIEELDIEF
jgi:glutathione S-transferase